MIDLGTQVGVPTLPAVTLSLDEMDFLVDKLALDVLPVVLDAGPRYDTYEARDEAFRRAVAGLTARDLLPGGEVRAELATRLQVLARPQWEIALRWYVDGSISRLCVSRGDTMSVLTMRAADTYVMQDTGVDIFAPVIAALGAADPLHFGVVNAPTTQLGEVFDAGGDGKALAAGLTALGVAAVDATAVGNAMATCNTYAEIVGIVYGDGQYDPVGGPVTVFDTQNGRIVGTSSVSAHGVAWSSLSPGTPQRLRQALEFLADRLH
ncbi:ESX secretion-associated protein EspG [Rhodococcus tibetensis]|uniref:ESX secretion-associated protein EspG n=1 Tax=Rhodococcus tibetensis TaxID=2965064 RepID=A0ABT1QE22_9NOCA|nr:ESX secretion-associated protein EspG [Rhodococcus sp. FXJ9.536]MCQ4120529.1 ESX secretion-associated protein EspG [Rhodococcus sp. FXJ9.536]